MGSYKCVTWLIPKSTQIVTRHTCRRRYGKSTKSRKTNFSVQIETKPQSQFEFIPRDTEELISCDLVDFGDVAFSVETVTANAVWDVINVSFHKCKWIMARMNESRPIYEWVTAHRDRRQACGMGYLWTSESCHTHQWVMSHTFEWVMSYIWLIMSHTSKSHVSRMNESRLTYQWVMSHVWVRHVAHINESHPPLQCVTSACKWVTAHRDKHAVWGVYE